MFAMMSADGLLPRVFSQVHPRLQTPWISQALIGLAVSAVAFTTPLNTLGELVGAGTLFAFILVCITVIYLRRTDPQAPRPFRVPHVPAIPVLGILSCLALLAGLSAYTWVRLAAWIALGLVVYAVYGRRHSRLRRGPG
jgi:APA family basic amino acid/polyamine antiporter